MDMESPNHVLLKFISQPKSGDKLKYLHDFLNGNLYMNTLSYFWNEYTPNKNEGMAGLATIPNTIPRAISQAPKGQADLLEGTVGMTPAENTVLAKTFKEHLLTDPIYRAKGFGYCNVLCFYRLDYQSFLTAGHKIITYDTSSAMNSFGQYVVIIKDEQELIRRISKKVEKEKFKFICGNVNYKHLRNEEILKRTHHIVIKSGVEINLEEIKDNIINQWDCFDKDYIYAYQNEWRVALYRGAKSTEAFTLKVGNLRDICEWVHISDLNKYLERMLKSKIKPGAVGYYGNIQRKELRNLFY